MTDFAEPASPGAGNPKGEGWRPVTGETWVRAYLANGWRDVRVTALNEVTREIRVQWPPGDSGTGTPAPHVIVSATLYEPPASGFPTLEPGDEEPPR